MPGEARWPVAAVAAVAFCIRYAGADTIPIAGDESVYLRWAEIVAHQGTWFVSLLDGKQPLSYWLYAIARWPWPEDPLFGARLISVLAGTLSTMGLWAIGRRLAGSPAGLAAAALYAVLPYAVLYDRLAYAESLVNLAGIGIAWAALRCREGAASGWRGPALLGLVMGLGFFVKSTAALFFAIPLVWISGWRRRAEAYTVALVFPLISWLAVPRAPMMNTHSLAVHRTDFFVPPEDLLRNPLSVAPGNLRLMGDYIAAYFTWPLALASLAALIVLARRRSAKVLLLLVAASVVPLLVQVLALQKMFPTRYPFPHLWPWLLVIAVLLAEVWNNPRVRIPALVALALAAAPAAVRGVCVSRTPAQCLHAEDAQTFLGSGPSAGWGIPEAASFLLREARTGALTVFTDPIWGPPADAMFAYLNQREGIRVYDAWWMTISPDHPILPPVPVELVKSQYERVSAGMLDPKALARAYYVTEAHYNPPESVLRREPGARRVASFLKPNQKNSIDVWRLR